MSMRESYMKNGQGFLLVYSITSQESYNYLLDFKNEIMMARDSTHEKVLIDKLDYFGHGQLDQLFLYIFVQKPSKIVQKLLKVSIDGLLQMNFYRCTLSYFIIIF